MAQATAETKTTKAKAKTKAKEKDKKPKTKREARAAKMAGTRDINAIINGIGHELEMAPCTPTDDGTSDLVEHPISTGLLSLDLTLGGGWSPTSVHVIAGLEGTGKTSIIYSTQRALTLTRDATVGLLLDAEASTGKARLRRAGVKLDWTAELAAKLPIRFRWWKHVDSGEKYFQLVCQLCDALEDRPDGPAQAVVYGDSLAALLPQARLENDENKQSGMVAKMFSDGFRDCKSRMGRKRVAMIATNQLREKVRQMGKGDPFYEACGNAIKFYSDVRLMLKKTVPMFSGKKAYIEEEQNCETENGTDRYHTVMVRVLKNKLFSPERTCIFRTWFSRAGRPGPGIDPVYDVFEYLRLTGQARRTNKGETIEIRMQGMKATKKTTWVNFKRYLLDPVAQAKEGHIVAKCWEQMATQESFSLYFKADSDDIVQASDDDEDE